MKRVILTMVATVMVAVSAFSQGYSVGDYAKDFKLKNVDGKMVSMADYKDAKGFIIIFTCNHCPFAKAYEDRIIALNKKYASKGFPVIAINPNDPNVAPDDSYDKMIERAKEKKFTFPYLLDEGQVVFPQYGATRTPHVFILSKETKGWQVKYIGAIDDNTENPDEVTKKYVEDAIAAIMAGKNPAVASTKAVGCTIKVKKS